MPIQTLSLLSARHNDPIVLAHARALLTGSEAGATEYVDGDVRDTDKIIGRARQLLDFSQPVAITMVSLLHAIPDADDPHAIVARLLGAVPPGSFIAMSHMASDILDDSKQQGLESATGRLIAQQLTYRSREDVTRFFTGTDILAPGIVRVEEWRPDGDDGEAPRSFLWSGAGRKT